MSTVKGNDVSLKEIVEKVGALEYCKDIEGSLRSAGVSQEQIEDMTEYSASLDTAPALMRGAPKSVWAKTHGFWSVTFYFSHDVAQNIPAHAGEIAAIFASMGPTIVLEPIVAAATMLGEARFKAVDKGKGVNFTLAYIAIPGLLTPATLCAYILAALKAN